MARTSAELASRYSLQVGVFGQVNAMALTAKTTQMASKAKATGIVGLHAAAQEKGTQFGLGLGAGITEAVVGTQICLEQWKRLPQKRVTTQVWLWGMRYQQRPVSFRKH